ncbi:MAG: 2'-deoxycytidine 5'-triphosphate deaminase domain-containing protein [Candidatus Woesearchaeota archaeon]
MYPEFMLTDKGILDFIARGELIISSNISQDQIQPASLDLRISQAKVYDEYSKTKNQLEYNERLEDLIRQRNFSRLDSLIEEIEKNATTYKDTNIIIPANTQYEASMKEKINLDSKYQTSFELRSSRGRALLRPSTIFFESGKVIGKNDNINDIEIEKHSKFLQIFIHPKTQGKNTGKLVRSKKRIRELMPNFPSYLIDDNGDIYFGIKEALRFNKIKETYLLGKNYERLTQKQEFLNGMITLREQTPYILGLYPEVETKGVVGIRLHHKAPSEQVFANRVVCAGWVDPGYKGIVTAHYKGLLNKMVRENEPVVRASVYEFHEGSILNQYGSKQLKSHYKGVKGTTTSRS